MFKKYFSYFCLIISLVMIIDFITPTNGVYDEIVYVKQTRENYYNAGGNSHVSYKIVTKRNLSFSVSEKFKKECKQNQIIKINKSIIFNEVNEVSINNGTISETYSLRYFSGIILPILFCFIWFVNFNYQKINALLMIVQLILFLNLFYIIFN